MYGDILSNLVAFDELFVSKSDIWVQEKKHKLQIQFRKILCQNKQPENDESKLKYLLVSAWFIYQ